MLLPRIIPCLLLKDGGLVKTVGFDDPKYVGDPINAVRIFNEKQVDELIVLDIDATINNREPDMEMISDLASECRMPICYGGGIKNIKQIRKIISLGIEKISISSAAIEDNNLIKKGAEIVGNQSIVVTIDVKKVNNNYIAFINNGKKKTDYNVIELVEKFQKLGAGEIVVNSIDDDGSMKGYNFDLINKIVEVISIPLTVIGGASSLDNIKLLFRKFGIMGASAGSLFVFKGVYRAVLINYPDVVEKEQLYLNHFQYNIN